MYNSDLFKNYAASKKKKNEKEKKAQPLKQWIPIIKRP